MKSLTEGIVPNISGYDEINTYLCFPALLEPLPGRVGVSVIRWIGDIKWVVGHHHHPAAKYYQDNNILCLLSWFL